MCCNGELYPENKYKCDKEYYGFHCNFKDKNLYHDMCNNEGYCNRGIKYFTQLNDDVQNYFKEFANNAFNNDKGTNNKGYSGNSEDYSKQP